MRDLIAQERAASNEEILKIEKQSDLKIQTLESKQVLLKNYLMKLAGKLSLYVDSALSNE